MHSNIALLIIDVQIGLIDGLPVPAVGWFQAGRHGITVKPATSVTF
jgi:hypothetical protein